MPAPHRYTHSTFRTKDRRPRTCSKVTRDDGAICRLGDLYPPEEAIERARRLFESRPSFAGTTAAMLEARFTVPGADTGDYGTAMRDLLRMLVEALPPEHELAPAVRAAYERKSFLPRK